MFSQIQTARTTATCTELVAKIKQDQQIKLAMHATRRQRRRRHCEIATRR